MRRASARGQPRETRALLNLEDSGYVVAGYGSEEWETFSEGLNLLHNPWAENPLDLGVLRGITEYQMVDDGRVLQRSHG
jgi:hypothetical protein